MIRIGVMSDSHGRLSYVTRAVREMGRVDWLVHLGDHDSDASEAGKVSDAPLAVVCGNCDWFSNFPAERLLELGGVRVLLTHGHQAEREGRSDGFEPEGGSDERAVDAVRAHAHSERGKRRRVRVRESRRAARRPVRHRGNRGWEDSAVFETAVSKSGCGLPEWQFAADFGITPLQTAAAEKPGGRERGCHLRRSPRGGRGACRPTDVRGRLRDRSGRRCV